MITRYLKIIQQDISLRWRLRIALVAALLGTPLTLRILVQMITDPAKGTFRALIILLISAASSIFGVTYLVDRLLFYEDADAREGRSPFDDIMDGGKLITLSLIAMIWMFLIHQASDQFTQFVGYFGIVMGTMITILVWGLWWAVVITILRDPVRAQRLKSRFRNIFKLRGDSDLVEDEY